LKTYEATMQWNSKTPDYIKRSNSASGSNLCPQPKVPLINGLINDRLLDAWPTVNQASS